MLERLVTGSFPGLIPAEFDGYFCEGTRCVSFCQEAGIFIKHMLFFSSSPFFFFPFIGILVTLQDIYCARIVAVGGES